MKTIIVFIHQVLILGWFLLIHLRFLKYCLSMCWCQYFYWFNTIIEKNVFEGTYTTVLPLWTGPKFGLGYIWITPASSFNNSWTRHWCSHIYIYTKRIRAHCSGYVDHRDRNTTYLYSNSSTLVPTRQLHIA